MFQYKNKVFLYLCAVYIDHMNQRGCLLHLNLKVNIMTFFYIGFFFYLKNIKKVS